MSVYQWRDKGTMAGLPVDSGFDIGCCTVFSRQHVARLGDLRSCTCQCTRFESENKRTRWEDEGDT